MMKLMANKRTVINADATDFLRDAKSFPAVVTSLPDAEETNMELPKWREWFIGCVKTIAAKTDTYAIFYQTDRKADGVLHSKAALVFKAAELAGANVVWHKIVLRRQPGGIDLFRPGFTHLICLSKKGKSGKATADVFERGKMIYDNSMGLNAARVALGFIKDVGKTLLIVDPFCGRGTILAAAEKMGMDSVGVDIDEQQCQHAQTLKFL
jgi:DNA methylase